MATAVAQNFEVDLPGGGKLQLRSVDEVDLFEKQRDRYVKDYSLSKTNDLVLLGALLSQNLAMFRAQQRLNGMEPVTDAQGVPTGQYKIANNVKPADMSAAQNVIIKAAEEVRAIEKALGIDKKTREAGGQHTVANYVTNLKRAAHQMGVHITARTKAYEKFVMELRWKVRLLKNGDPEDRQYHNITPTSIIDWAEQEMAKLEEIDKKFAKDKGRVFAGKL